jgi:queuine tRNA-ribosyltransferase
MPVGTQGSVKTLGSEDLEGLGFELVLANTYHLALRPTSERVERLGGLHKFMSWKGSILTDSGGYQAMSLSGMRKMTEEGVEFRSHLDGSSMFLSPERAIEIQGQLGVDMSMCLDECPPYPAERKDVERAVERTTRWAKRCMEAKRDGQGVFGIVQGGVHEDLRAQSAAEISSLPFDGIAIGGVSVGEPTEMQYPVVQFTAPLLPANKIRYLMGVGHPRDILHAVSCGVDLFDCVLPTRMARHQALYTLQGRVNVGGKKWEEHNGLVDPGSVFPQTERYSAAYMRHLFKAGEALGPRLATLHNLAFYGRLMQEIRSAIEGGSWQALMERYAMA